MQVSPQRSTISTQTPACLSLLCVTQTPLSVRYDTMSSMPLRRPERRGGVLLGGCWLHTQQRARTQNAQLLAKENELIVSRSSTLTKQFLTRHEYKRKTSSSEGLQKVGLIVVVSSLYGCRCLERKGLPHVWQFPTVTFLSRVYVGLYAAPTQRAPNSSACFGKTHKLPLAFLCSISPILNLPFHFTGSKMTLLLV